MKIDNPELRESLHSLADSLRKGLLSKLPLAAIRLYISGDAARMDILVNGVVVATLAEEPEKGGALS